MSFTKSSIATAVYAVCLVSGAFAARPEQAAALDCNDYSTIKDPFYSDDAGGRGGKGSSDVYDTRFHGSHSIPELDSHIPQGLATWSNWSDRVEGGQDLLLITARDPKHNQALIIGLDAKTGQKMGMAQIKDSHVGGIAVFEKLGWAFVSSEREGYVRKYSLAKLRDAISFSEEKILEADGRDQPVIGSSFLTSHGPTKTLWAGTFFQTKPGKMQAYEVDSEGKLTALDKTWEVPQKTQGVVVTKDLIIYSTSYDRDHRSNLYVVRRGRGETDLSEARAMCFRAPSMAEGLAVYGKNVFLAYESGAREFNDDDNAPRNTLTHLHKAPLAELKALPPTSGPQRPEEPAPKR